MPTFNTTIGEGLPVEITLDISGEDHPATMVDPEEHRELLITEVMANGFDIGECLNEATWEYLQAECEECQDD